MGIRIPNLRGQIEAWEFISATGEATPKHRTCTPALYIGFVNRRGGHKYLSFSHVNVDRTDLRRHFELCIRVHLRPQFSRQGFSFSSGSSQRGSLCCSCSLVYKNIKIGRKMQACTKSITHPNLEGMAYNIFQTLTLTMPKASISASISKRPRPLLKLFLLSCKPCSESN